MKRTNDVLKHFGVLGMHWGVRKRESDHADHTRAREISKKKIRNMTDQELNLLLTRKELERQHGGNTRSKSNSDLQKEIARKNLEKEFRKSHITFSKHLKKMSDDDLRTAVARDRLKQNEFKNGGVPRTKKIGQLNEKEAKALLTRSIKERRLKDMTNGESKKARILLATALVALSGYIVSPAFVDTIEKVKG